MKNKPVLKACEIAGSQAALAVLIGVTPQTVNQWITRVRPVPPTQCFPIEQATNGAVTRQELRPDDWAMHWPELATKRTRKAAK